MRILHYSLGFPPYRSGGLTKFCMDLMIQQIDEGHEVALLWPGRMGFLFRANKVINRGCETYRDHSIRSFEIINPLPVSYDEGIADYESFTREGDISAYMQLFESYRPDVIHIHTLMGLHISFLKAARNKSIRTVFTTHDFFPICPKVTMFRDGDVCADVVDCSFCGDCNSKSLSLNKIRILQSPLYRTMKDSALVKTLRKRHRTQFYEDQSYITVKSGFVCRCDYKKLRQHYSDMLNLMDCIHFNSSLTREIYERYFGRLEGSVVAISHYDISDHRKRKMFDDECIKMRYLGPYNGAKGFFRLRDTLDKLWQTKKNFRLDVHFDCLGKTEYMKINDRYDYSELESIFDDTDVLIVPSVWYETFGYTVLEALSYGVPVVVTDRVGAKEIMHSGAGIVVNVSDENSLYDSLNGLDAAKLRSCNESIIANQRIITMSEVSDIIIKELYCKRMCI